MLKESLRKYFPARPTLGWPVVALLASLYIVVADNRLFWTSFFDRLGPSRPADWFFMATIGLTLLLLLTLVFTLCSFRRLFKPAVALFLVLCAGVSYFADSFGVVVSPSMIHNVLETNAAEASELFTLPMVMHYATHAVVPIALLLWIRVAYGSWRRELLLKGAVVAGSVVLTAGLALANYKEITFFGRENKDLQVYINPVYPLHSLKKVVKASLSPHRNQPLQTIAGDARRVDRDPKEVVVLVVGETARSQSFSLNGYGRKTNPLLEKQDIIDFRDVTSCGTATAESVPCMFSPQGHANYSSGLAAHSENILDVLNHNGVKILWRDNDSGSKGVASRVAYQELTKQADPQLCSGGECYDEILLQGLEEQLTSSPDDALIVLHTIGSHGPSYYKRVPQRFKVFQPECAQDNVQDCSQQEIVNSYDNTILYTDYLLNGVIEILKRQDFATAMLYVSDHGESLGENGIYLHGLPYAMAPAEQTHVPMIFWASDRFYAEKRLDRAALAGEQADHLSHDNLFHSLLGIFGVESGIYRPGLDIFARAHAGGQGKAG